MTRRVHAGMVGFTLLLAAAAGGCDRSPTSPPPAESGGGRSLERLTIGGPLSIAPGETARYTATAHYSNGSSEDVTAVASWTPPAHASSPLRFTTAGVASAVRPGENIVTATYGAKAASMHVLVLPPGTFKLSGTIAEAGGGPLSGVTVEVVSGTGQGLQTITESQGRYALYGVAGQVGVRASADGFTPQVREVVVNGSDATEGFALVPAEMPADVSGLWTMTLFASQGCRAGLPEIAKGRAYGVQLIQQGTALRVGISGPTVQHVTPSQHFGSVFGSRVLLSIVGDTDYGDWTTPDFYDLLSPTETLGFSGRAEGTVTSAEIRATMYGDLAYWNSNVQTFVPTWNCRARDHELILRR